MTIPTVVVTATRVVVPPASLAAAVARPAKPSSELSRLMAQPRADADFQRLLEKEFTPKGRAPMEEVKVIARKRSKFLRAGRALSRFSGAATLLFFSNDMANALLNWNKRNFTRTPESALKQVPKSSPARDQVAIQPTNGFARNAQALEEIYVTATKEKSLRSSGPTYAQTLARLRSGSRTPTAKTPASSNAKRPSRSSARNASRSVQDVLTSLNEAGLGFTPKTQTQRARPPPDRDTCTRVRSPRPACPARGYKLVCKQWSKQSCR